MGVWVRGLVLLILAGCSRIGTAENPLDLDIPTKALNYIEIAIDRGMWMRIPGKNLPLSDVIRVYENDSGYVLHNNSESDILVEISRDHLYRDAQEILLENGYEGLPQLAELFPRNWCDDIADAGGQILTVVTNENSVSFRDRCSGYSLGEERASIYDRSLDAVIIGMRVLMNTD